MIRSVVSMSIVLLALGPTARAEQPEGLKQLKEKRLALLLKIHEATKKGQRIDPAMPPDQVRKTMVDVFAAKLDLAETKADRIKIWEEAVKYAQEWEKQVKEMRKNGFAAPVDLLNAEAYVLEARIGLEKARQR